MKLVTCPECGKQVSDKYKACPFCKAPLPAVVERDDDDDDDDEEEEVPVSRRRRRLRLFVKVLPFILVFAAGIFVGHNVDKILERTGIKGAADRVTDTVQTVQNALSKNKKNDTKVVGGIDHPLELGKTITIHSTLESGDGEADMFKAEITPESMERVGDDCIVEVRFKLLSLDGNDSQPVSISTLIDCMNIINEDGTTGSDASAAFRSKEDAAAMCTGGSAGGAVSELSKGSDVTLWIAYFNDPSPNLLRVGAYTQVDEKNTDWVYNYYKLK